MAMLAIAHVLLLEMSSIRTITSNSHADSPCYSPCHSLGFRSGVPWIKPGDTWIHPGVLNHILEERGCPGITERKTFCFFRRGDV